MSGSAQTSLGRRRTLLQLWGRFAAGVFLVLFGIAVLLGQPAGAQSSPGAGRSVLVLELDLPIDNVTERFVSRALASDAAQDAEVVIIRLDTPGGLSTAMRDMVSEIFSSTVPVVVFVAPEGARAASAGTFITAAAGVAAMAPATNIGAASVVGGQGEDLPETLGRKATQDAVAFLRSIAERRGRDSDALAATVLTAKAYSAQEALEEGIIDLVSDDLPDLLRQLDGRTIPVAAGERTVQTEGASLRFVELNFYERVLSFLSDPSIAFLLISFGGLAIIVELFNFGTVLPGVLGVVMLVLGFAGVGQLPFSWAGIGLILLAMVFFFVEIQAPGIGFFGVLGAVALVLGGLFLVGFFGAPELPGSPRLRVNRWVVAGIGIAAGVAVTSLAWQLQRARKIPGYVSPVASEALIGQVVRVARRLDPRGEVQLAGEYWEAVLPPGQHADEGTLVRVVDVSGYQLEVELVAAGEESSEAAEPTHLAQPESPGDTHGRGRKRWRSSTSSRTTNGSPASSSDGSRA
jgi:membrane-bound serine protease (ClpP class)